MLKTEQFKDIEKLNEFIIDNGISKTDIITVNSVISELKPYELIYWTKLSYEIKVDNNN